MIKIFKFLLEYISKFKKKTLIYVFVFALLNFLIHLKYIVKNIQIKIQKFKKKKFIDSMNCSLT